MGSCQVLHTVVVESIHQRLHWVPRVSIVLSMEGKGDELYQILGARPIHDLQQIDVWQLVDDLLLLVVEVINATLPYFFCKYDDLPYGPPFILRALFGMPIWQEGGILLFDLVIHFLKLLPPVARPKALKEPEEWMIIAVQYFIGVVE